MPPMTTTAAASSSRMISVRGRTPCCCVCCSCRRPFCASSSEVVAASGRVRESFVPSGSQSEQLPEDAGMRCVPRTAGHTTVLADVPGESPLPWRSFPSDVIAPVARVNGILARAAAFASSSSPSCQHSPAAPVGAIAIGRLISLPNSVVLVERPDTSTKASMHQPDLFERGAVVTQRELIFGGAVDELEYALRQALLCGFAQVEDIVAVVERRHFFTPLGCGMMKRAIRLSSKAGACRARLPPRPLQSAAHAPSMAGRPKAL